MTTQHIDFALLDLTFGDKLRKIRRAAGESQKAMAEKLGITSARLSAWEAQPTAPRGEASIAKRVELAYGVSATWLLGLTENPRPGGGGPDGGGEYTARDSNPEPAD